MQCDWCHGYMKPNDETKFCSSACATKWQQEHEPRRLHPSMGQKPLRQWGAVLALTVGLVLGMTSQDVRAEDARAIGPSIPTFVTFAYACRTIEDAETWIKIMDDAGEVVKGPESCALLHSGGMPVLGTMTPVKSFMVNQRMLRVMHIESIIAPGGGWYTWMQVSGGENT